MRLSPVEIISRLNSSYWFVPLVVTLLLVALAGLALWGVGSLGPVVLVGLALFSFCHFGLLDRVARPARLRALVAFAFGLVHGFGFAAILGELELPRERLVAALFGFNLGVELGQLVIVLALWPLLRALARLRGGRTAGLVLRAGRVEPVDVGLDAGERRGGLGREPPVGLSQPHANATFPAGHGSFSRRPMFAQKLTPPA